MESAKCKIGGGESAKCKMQNAKCKMQSAKLGVGKVQNAKCKIAVCAVLTLEKANRQIKI